MHCGDPLVHLMAMHFHDPQNRATNNAKKNRTNNRMWRRERSRMRQPCCTEPYAFVKRRFAAVGDGVRKAAGGDVESRIINSG